MSAARRSIAKTESPVGKKAQLLTFDQHVFRTLGASHVSREGVIPVPKSIWKLSGRHWTGWTATWAGLAAAVVAMPSAPDKRVTLAHPANTSQDAATVDASPVSVVMRRVDFGALPETAFGDFDPKRDQR